MRVIYAFQGRQSVLDTDHAEVVIGWPREGLIVHLAPARPATRC